MKRFFLFILTGFLLLSYSTQAQWVSINSSKSVPAKVDLISSSASSIMVRFTVDGFHKELVNTPQGKAYRIHIEEGTRILERGAPDLPKLTAPLAIPAMDEMAVRVISQKYSDIQNLDIAPSKGNLTRDIDPSTVPYTYGKAYQRAGYYPGFPAMLREPYILRDVRGQALVVYPFQYDAQNKTLRVIEEMVVEVYSTGNTGFNTLNQPPAGKLSREFQELYSSHFLNYSTTKYTPLQDEGNMLIISHGPYMSEMQDFVQWKNMSGMPTEIVDVSTIGTSSTAIKNYISTYYTTNGLTFLLLVGDAAHIPPVTTSSGHSDNAYGYLSGNDSYPEVFVGRFSAENLQDVQTQVLRTLMYERDASINDLHYNASIGIASSQGPGDDNEMDYQHIRNMQTDLLAYTYSTNLEYFDGSQGGNDASGNPTPSQVATGINSGAGVILYTGHGSSTSWGSSGFSSSNINSLTNGGMLPFIWSVACVNGNFVGNTCFAEAWLRARSGDQPRGAVATLMSTINQSWDPPMEAQDEMVDILVESYSSNIKRTFGGLSMNGCMQMNDTYGSAGDEMTDTWNLFGDPSLMVRTDTPRVITATYQNPLLLGSSQMTISCPLDSALVTLSENGQILASTKVSSGMATLNFPVLTSLDSLHLVITAYNHIPHIATIQVIPASGPFVIYSHSSVVDSAGNQNGLPDYGEDIVLDVALKNIGVAMAGQVTATLSTTDSMVTINTPGNSWGNINPGDTTMLHAAYSISISDAIPDQHSIMFDLDVADTAGNSWSSNMSMKVNAPDLRLQEIIVDDASGGNGNGILEPGETATLLLPVKNSGHADAGPALVMLASTNPFAILDSNMKTLGSLPVSGTAQAAFVIHVDSSIALGSNLALPSSVASGQYNDNRTYYLAVGEVNEDFETGDFSKFSWVFGSGSSWVIDPSFPYEGMFCAKTGNIGNSSTTYIEITLDVLSSDTISFYRKVSSEQYYDFFSFYIDGNLQDEWSGNVSWGKVSYPVSAGTHTFKWEYAKDFMVSSGSDCAWMDYVSFPPISLGSAPLGVTAIANPSSICEGESTQITSFVGGGSGNYTYSWSPATGLDDPNIANPVANPISTTQYSLTVDDGSSTATATVNIVVHSVPVAPVITQQGNSLVSDATTGNQWYNDNGPIAGATTVVYSPLVDGNYYVVVTNSEGCESQASNVIYFTISGIGEDDPGISLRAWPNPATDKLNLSYHLDKDGMMRISLLDMLGQEVEVYMDRLMDPGKHQHSFDLGKLKGGIYLLRLAREDEVSLLRVVVR